MQSAGDGRVPAAGTRRSRERAKPERVPGAALDWIALGLAIVLPPLGLLAGLVAVVAGSRSRGWASEVAKAATAIAIVLSIVTAGGLVAIVGASDVDAQFDGTVASSREFCGVLDTAPGILASSTFKWPAPGATVTDSIEIMVAYEAFWLELETAAPEGIAGEAAAVAAAARSIITAVESSRIIDRDDDLEVMASVAAGSRIPGWAKQYCL